MPVEQRIRRESLRRALRCLVPAGLLCLSAQCGCVSTAFDQAGRQMPRDTPADSVVRVSLRADEDSGVAVSGERDETVEFAEYPRELEGEKGAKAEQLPTDPAPVNASSVNRPSVNRPSGKSLPVNASSLRRPESSESAVEQSAGEGLSSGHSLLPRLASETSERGEGVSGAPGVVRGGAVGGQPAVSEPGMLDRFRALYVPRGESPARSDDGTERLRRQMLRWSDPFGLLKERESAGGEGLSAELSAEGGEAASADVSPGVLGPRVSLEAVIASLEEELRGWPVSANGVPERMEEWRRCQTDLRLLYSVTGRSADAARVIEGLPREEQEFWQSLMLAMNQYRADGVGELRTEQLTEALNQVRAAARHLQPLSRLEIYRLQFCTRIDGFGNAAAFPTADFEPGQRLLLYAGVRNFRSELTGEGRYRSEFAAVVEFLREEDGEVLERIRLPPIPDECDEERTDYFQSFELTAPVLEGSYIVRLHLRDELTRQTSEARLRMTIR